MVRLREAKLDSTVEPQALGRYLNLETVESYQIVLT